MYPRQQRAMLMMESAVQTPSLIHTTSIKLAGNLTMMQGVALPDTGGKNIARMARNKSEPHMITG